MIVVGEALTAILFALGTVELLRSQKFCRAGFSPCQAVCSCRGRLRIPCSVYRLSCCWWLMVCDVAVTNLEWPAARVSHPRINSSRSDLRCPTGRRTLTQGPCKAPRPHPQSQNCARWSRGLAQERAWSALGVTAARRMLRRGPSDSCSRRRPTARLSATARLLLLPAKFLRLRSLPRCDG